MKVPRSSQHWSPMPALFLALLVVGLFPLGCMSRPTAQTRSGQNPTASPAAGQQAVILSGFLKSKSSESIGPASGDEWSFNIMMLAPEGSRVQAGDLVAKLEGENYKTRLQEAESKLVEAQVKAESKLTEIKNAIDDQVKKITDSKNELELLRAGHIDTAKNHAASWLISQRDVLQEELDIESKELALKIDKEKLTRQRQRLDIARLSTAKDVATHQARVDKLKFNMSQGERRTKTGGVVMYVRNSWKREKPRVGSAVYRGSAVLEIVDDQHLYVEAYLKEENWSAAKVGEPVTIKVLGRREVMVGGKISRISSIVMKASDWDRSLPEGHPLFNTSVFQVEIALDHVPPEAKPAGEVIVTLDTQAKDSASNKEKATRHAS